MKADRSPAGPEGGHDAETSAYLVAPDGAGRIFHMQLLIIRHGKAQDREAFASKGQSDANRPLTRSGKRKMKSAVRGLQRLYRRIDLLCTSPLKRAVQTAHIVNKTYGDIPEFVELPELSPSRKPAALLEWLRENQANRTSTDPQYTVAVVGHEPHLGRFTGWLLTQKEKPIVKFKKGGVCVVRFPESINAGRAQLEAVLPTGVLRKIAR